MSFAAKFSASEALLLSLTAISESSPPSRAAKIRSPSPLRLLVELNVAPSIPPIGVARLASVEEVISFILLVVFSSILNPPVINGSSVVGID